MKIKIATSAVAVLMAHSPMMASAGDSGRYEDPAYGFSLSMPPLGESRAATTVQRLVVAGPARDGFAPNCNVQVQFANMDLPAFVDLSLRQFQAAGLKVARNTPRKVSGHPSVLLEYFGPMGGRELRFMALAVGATDRVWLLTCTALASTFDDHRPAFQQAIDSFALTEPKNRGAA